MYKVDLVICYGKNNNTGHWQMMQFDVDMFNAPTEDHPEFFYELNQATMAKAMEVLDRPDCRRWFIDGYKEASHSNGLVTGHDQ